MRADDSKSTPKSDSGSEFEPDLQAAIDRQGKPAKPSGPIEFATDPELAPDPVKVDPSFTMQDFDAALKDDLAPDASIEDIAQSVRRWHEILVFVGKKKTMLAWRIGRALASARLRIPNGKWYAFLKDEFPDLSKTTIWRYIQLFERSPDRVPKKPLTDAYVDLGIASNGRNTVEDYFCQLAKLVSEIWKVQRTINGIKSRRTELMNHISEDDFAGVDAKQLVEYETGVNDAIKNLADSLDFNPSDNVFARFGDAIGPSPKLAVMEHIARGLRTPYGEYASAVISAECIPSCLLEPDVVERWKNEHLEELTRNRSHAHRRRMIYNMKRMNEDRVGW